MNQKENQEEGFSDQSGNISIEGLQLQNGFDGNSRPNDQKENQAYFKPLTGVRAIAAYLVFIHHFPPFLEQEIGSGLFNFFNELHVGVTMFFVLSGFLIAYRYSDLKQFSFRKYLVNRVARIYPMYFILTTCTFCLYGLILHLPPSTSLDVYLLNISFLRGFFEEFKFTGIAQGWSLTVEETFYFLAPLIFLLVKRSYLYLFILPFLFVLIGVGLVLAATLYNYHGFFSTFEFMFNYTFFGRCFEFFIGIGLAIVYKKKRYVIYFKRYTYFGLFIIVLSIYCISLVKGDQDFGIRTPIGKLINHFFLPLFGISFFYLGLLIEKTFISKILGSQLFVILGKSSYIFYLIHVGFLSVFMTQISQNYFVIFLGINITSYFLFDYVEEPLNNYLRKKLGGGGLVREQKSSG